MLLRQALILVYWIKAKVTHCGISPENSDASVSDQEQRENHHLLADTSTKFHQVLTIAVTLQTILTGGVFIPVPTTCSFQA